jgi:hypothetical protein
MNRKNLLSLCCVSFFILLALASTTNKISYGAFNYGNRVEDMSEKSNYLEKNDGSRVYGEKIKWKSGLLVKDQIQIDGEKFPITEIRGYRQDDSYFGRYKNEYVHRIVHGKINVYVLISQVTTTSTDHNGFTHTSSRTVATHYSQRGEDGPMVVFTGKDDIKELVRGCPLAVEMASITNKQLRKAIRKDRNYLNSIFEVYNNDCKAGYLK